jgi:hypothetical protein
MGNKKQIRMSWCKRLMLIYLLQTLSQAGKTQSPDLNSYDYEQLEDKAEKNDVESGDDSYLTDLEQYKQHPLNMNSVSEEELMQLHIPEYSQIKNFISYRKMLGPLLSIYELQAIPGWNLETIRRILPFVSVQRDESVYISLKERWKVGDRDFLLLASRVLEKSKGYANRSKPNDAFYEGSPEKIFLRYSYNYKQLLGYGFTGAKDAGEPFFRGAQRYGFDFYSFHFFLQHSGLIRSLAIGDFTVNLGQGLIQWQSFSIIKSSQSLAIKRESACLRPYHSAGDFNFHRGLGISLQKGKWQSTCFLSFKKISTNLETDSTSLDSSFSSFETSGYHRTAAEIADRNDNSQLAVGGTVQYAGRNFSMGFNTIHYQFGKPLQKRDLPYNLYSLKGKYLSDYSLDYSYTVGNLHLFGEFAEDRQLHSAFIQGALVSLGEHLDLGFIYRNISPAFQSLYSSSFTENNVPVNERGLYSGLSFKPTAAIRCDVYYDLFVFPWVKYEVDGPTHGQDFLFHLTFQPNKNYQLTASYKQELKPVNGTVTAVPTPALVYPLKKRIRIASDIAMSRSIHSTSRVEWVTIYPPGSSAENGFLGMTGLTFSRPGFSATAGAVLFETDNYDARIYSYEPDLLYNFYLPAFYERGMHYYLSLHKDILRSSRHIGNHFRLAAWIKWDQTFYPGATSIGTGLDEITGNRKTEIKAQVLMQWN